MIIQPLWGIHQSEINIKTHCGLGVFTKQNDRSFHCNLYGVNFAIRSVCNAIVGMCRVSSNWPKTEWVP